MQLEDRFYTSTEVAEILGVSLRSVYRYLEDGKLKAEVKTATGRHRFTKQNIVNFLYPDGASTSIFDESKESSKQSFTGRTEVVTAAIPAQTVATPQVSIPVEQTPASAQEEEPVDWLAKFREAATKYKHEEPVQEVPAPVQQIPDEPIAPVQPVQQQVPSQQPEIPQPLQQPVMQTPQPVQQPVMQTPQPVQQPVAPTPQPVQQPVMQTPQPAMPQPVQQPVMQAPQPVQQPAAPTATFMYYRSMLGGLKDIAQNIDKSAKNSNLDYAFTLNAGASLHKPIKPFATLHAYVRSGDRDFFEKILRLTSSNKSNAQLCLVLSDDSSIYSNKEAVHGLNVVDKAQLRKDIAAFGDPQLAQEMADVL